MIAGGGKDLQYLTVKHLNGSLLCYACGDSNPSAPYVETKAELGNFTNINVI